MLCPEFDAERPMRKGWSETLQGVPPRDGPPMDNAKERAMSVVLTAFPYEAAWASRADSITAENGLGTISEGGQSGRRRR